MTDRIRDLDDSFMWAMPELSLVDAKQGRGEHGDFELEDDELLGSRFAFGTVEEDLAPGNINIVPLR